MEGKKWKLQREGRKEKTIHKDERGITTTTRKMSGNFLTNKILPQTQNKSLRNACRGRHGHLTNSLPYLDSMSIYAKTQQLSHVSHQEPPFCDEGRKEVLAGRRLFEYCSLTTLSRKGIVSESPHRIPGKVCAISLLSCLRRSLLSERKRFDAFVLK